MSLLGPINTGLTGIQASARGLAVSANNIANSSTKGFSPSSVTFQSQPGGGVTVEIRQDAQAGFGSDITEEALNLNAMEIAAKANAAVIKMADEMLGTLIDTLA